MPFPGRTFEEVLHLLDTSEPVAPRILRPRTDADLETICLKALAKDPRRRYESMRAFADDLGRYLDGEAILARPPSLAHRAGRWFRRRRKVVFAAGLAVAFAGSVAWAVAAVRSARAFGADREVARSAYRDGEWSRAADACERALARRDDSELARILEECRARLERERRDQERRLAAAERLRRLRSERVQPLRTKIQELRILAYAPGVDLSAREEEMRRALDALPIAEYGDLPDLWLVLGAGRYLLGEGEAAESALLRAEELDPEAGWVRYFLGRIYVERAVAALLVREEQNPRDVYHALVAESQAWYAKAARRFRGETRLGTGAEPIDLELARV